MRIELALEYLGKNYCGYQRQKNGLSIQECLENAYYSLTGERVNMLAAGRTDAQVSAIDQHVHFDTVKNIPEDKIFLALNTFLPPDIRVLESREVADDFHVRYCAKSKIYRYSIINQQVHSAINYMTCCHVPKALDLEAMLKQSKYLLGEHDFSSFCAAGAQTKTTIRIIYDIIINKQDNLITIDVLGNGFLYNMVRIIAGTLIEVGKGKNHDIKKILEAKNRACAGATAPAHGLTLIKVNY